MKGNESEVMETTEDNRIRQKFLLAPRLYLDGVYRDAPPEVLPAPPEYCEQLIVKAVFSLSFCCSDFFSIYEIKTTVGHSLWLFVLRFAHFEKDLLLTNLEH